MDLSSLMLSRNITVRGRPNSELTPHALLHHAALSSPACLAIEVWSGSSKDNCSVHNRPVTMCICTSNISHKAKVTSHQLRGPLLARPVT
jgi:hypothetical protein